MADHRFLLVQLADIGDLVSTTPAISALREAFPQAQIDLFASRHAISIMPPKLVNDIIIFEKGDHNATRAFLSWENFRTVLSLSSRKYNTVIFFHHFTLKAGVFKFRFMARMSRAKQVVGLKNDNVSFLTDSIPDGGFGAKHQAQYWLDLVGVVGADSRPRPAQVHREDYVDMIGFQTRPFAINQSVPKVVIHAGSGGYSTARRWIPERFAQVADQLKFAYNAEIILVGKGDDDSDEVAELMHYEPTDLVAKTTLPQLADVIQHADLFIGADSGVMHIASATGTPVVSIFGPSNYRAWHPWSVGGRASVLTSQVKCSPCSYVGHSIGARDGCEARTCMNLVTQQRVLSAAKRILDNQPRKRDEMPSEIEITAQSVPAPRIKVLGVPVDGITYILWMKQIHEWMRHTKHPHHVCTVNPEFIMVAQDDPIFFNILNRADLCVPDGVGLLWATGYLGQRVPERVTGSDGVPLIAQYAAKYGWKLFFLGAGPGIADKAADSLRKQNPSLQIVGTYGGSPASFEEEGITKMINHSGADILFVAFGAPEQDKWIARNLPRLNVKMAMGIGGSLDFIAGVVPRAPLWMQKYGLEWLYRLIRQPWRFKRMLRLPRFVLAVILRRHN
jgi:N-acetylglucosaminyldiphosphoundecaprenol N-acetyl-beta-D-mannosaminyltransferase